MQLRAEHETCSLLTVYIFVSAALKPNRLYACMYFDTTDTTMVSLRLSLALASGVFPCVLLLYRVREHAPVPSPPGWCVGV